MNNSNPHPGWYPDPNGHPMLRWWNGFQWGEQTQAAPSPSAAQNGNGYSTAGIILGAIAFILFPIICGPAGLILGGIAMSKGESRAVVALVVSAVGMIVGFLLGALVWSSMVV